MFPISTTTITTATASASTSRINVTHDSAASALEPFIAPPVVRHTLNRKQNKQRPSNKQPWEPGMGRFPLENKLESRYFAWMAQHCASWPPASITRWLRENNSPQGQMPNRSIQAALQRYRDDPTAERFANPLRPPEVPDDFDETTPPAYPINGGRDARDLGMVLEQFPMATVDEFAEYATAAFPYITAYAARQWYFSDLRQGREIPPARPIAHSEAAGPNDTLMRDLDELAAQFPEIQAAPVDEQAFWSAFPWLNDDPGGLGPDRLPAMQAASSTASTGWPFDDFN